ncbi:unnamed protein product, partial [Symbiodinium necroappetens]
LGQDHSETIACRELLGKVLASLGDLDQAVHELNQVVELQSKTIGPKSVQALEAMQALASLKESAALQGNGSVKRLGDSVSVTRAAVNKGREDRKAVKDADGSSNSTQ